MINTPLTLLYVEDCPETRDSIAIILKSFFKTVILAIDGEDGFNKFTKNQIDIIVTDVHLPKLNGMDMIKKIRAIDNDVCILITSAYSDTNYLIQSIAYRIHDYLFKPIQKQEFQNKLIEIQEQVIEKKSKQKQIRLLEDYKKIADQSSIISKTDVDGYIIYVNDEFCRTSGFSRSELIGKRHNIIRHPDEPKEVFEELWRTIKKRKKTWQGVIKNQSKNGEIYYVKTMIKPIFNSDGTIKEFISSRVLLNDIIHPQKQLYDFIKPMHESIVILIKIEDFKYIDGYNNHHDLKEEMQKDFAIKLFNMLPKECDFYKIYLLNNGEFAIAKNRVQCNNLKCLDNDCQNIKKMIIKMKKFQKDINSAKINMGYIDYDLSIIISFAYGKNALEDAKSGLRSLLESKEIFIVANGFSKESQNKSISRIKTFKMIKKAIDSYNIISYFQPIINNKTKQIEKYESLVRLIDENDNILSPYAFLDVSKKGKYYAQITSMVLENSFKALHETKLSISINFSALDIEKKETRTEFINLLKINKTDAKRVILEFTEDEDINDYRIIKQFIQEVKELGVQIAIDDFGVGYSSFERVLDYKPDILKIDGRLIKHINEDNVSYSIVESIVSFAKKEHLQTIAEFVENEEIYNTLCDLGVDYSQGYYFGKPNALQK